MNREIEEIIKKNLPQQVGEVLKERLEQAEIDAELVLKLKATVSGYETAQKELHRELETYRQFDERNRTLDLREKELEKRENQLEVNTLKGQLSQEQESKQFAKEVALGLVRNTNYRKSVYDNELVDGHTDFNGNWVNGKNVTKTYNEDKIAD